MFIRLSYILVVLIIGNYPVLADITPENCHDYLESGEANYDIAVSTGSIEWDIDTEEIEGNISGLEKRLSDKPDDTEAIIELISLYSQIDRRDEATNLAQNNLALFEDNYLTRGDEASAVAFAKAVIGADNDDLCDKAYLGLQPFLESGEADEEVFKAAISLRIMVNDYELATRIADVYVTFYPDEASAHYQKFSVIAAKNIYGVVAYWLQKSVEVFLEGRGETAINESNAKFFIEDYIKRIAGAFEISSLENAAELDPENYEYNLAAAIFKTLIVYYSAIGSVSVSEGLDETDLLDLFRVTDPEGLANILPYLEKAESVRPETDVQVYLAYALYYMSFGDFEKAQDYARLAVDTRPDLPEAYDALIIVTVLPVAIEIQEDPGIAADIFPELLDEKIANTGGTAFDFAVLGAVEFFRYPNTDAANREEVLKQMKLYVDKSLANDANNPTALLNLGNYYILKGEYANAIAISSDAYVAAGPDKKPLFLNNRGIAKVLAGDREGGITDLKKAIDISDGNERSSEALAALGIE